MAVDFALFLSPDGIALAHRQREGHWAFLGETSLEVPDLGNRLAALREAGEQRAGPEFATLLVLPEEQILYTEIEVDTQGPDLTAAVGHGLDGRTPYALGELAFDYREVASGRVQVAVVAQKTLTEAIDFARSAGFNGVGFTATPPEAYFPGMPIFDLVDGVRRTDLPTEGLAFGLDTWDDVTAVPELEAEPAQVFVREAVPVEEPTEDAPDPFDAEFEPPPETEPEDEVAPEPAAEEEPAEAEAAEEDDAPDLDDSDAPDIDDIDAPIPVAAERADVAEEAEPVELPEAMAEAAEPLDASESEIEAADETDAETVDTVEDAVEPGKPSEDVDPAEAQSEAEDPEEEILAAFRRYAVPAADASMAAADAPDEALEPEPEPDSDLGADPSDDSDVDTPPDLAASMADVDEQAASFVTDTPAYEPAAEPDLVQLDEPPAPYTDRPSRIDLRLSADDTEAAEETPEYAELEPDQEPESEPKFRARTPKRRIARTPALFAGGGQPHEEISPVLTDPMVAREPDEPVAEPVVEPLPEAPAVGLAERLRRNRLATQTRLEDSETTFAFRRTPELSKITRPEVMDDAMITGGVLARRSDPSVRPSLRTALVLTVVLVLVLALIAVWSALFLPDSRVAQIFGRVAPEVAAPLELPEASSAAEPAIDAPPAPLAALAPPEGAVAEPEVEPAPAVAAPELEPEPTPAPVLAARVPPPTLEEAQAEYETYRIWQLAPNPPAEPSRDFLIPEPGETIQLAAIDPVILGYDAVALTTPASAARPRTQPSPPPFGALTNPQGLLDATPDGVLTPDGAFVVLGTPDLEAAPRPGDAPIVAAASDATALAPEAEPDGDLPALTAAGGLTDAILAAFPPTVRPEDFDEQLERQRLGGFTTEELADRRPVTRPDSLQEIAAAAAEATVDSELAIAASPSPTTRPAAVETAAAEALARGPAATASLSVPEQEPVAPPTVEPDIPSNASVSRSATVENGINLREVNLIGVRGTPENREALVRLASGRFVEVTVGDRLDGGQVVAIGADSLQYVRNGRNIVLEAPSG